MPIRQYETPSGNWSTDNPDLMRLLHNDFPFVIENIAKLQKETSFVVTSTECGSNPYYCIRNSSSEDDVVQLFHLAQENLDELHSGLSIISSSRGLQLNPVRVRFSLNNVYAINIDGQKIHDEAMILTAPALIWGRKFVGWERYTRETYDCRHIIRLQYPLKEDPEFERIRSEIQRLQRLWQERDKYIKEIFHLAKSIGFSEYERMLLGITRDANNRFVVLSSLKGTAEEVAEKLIAEHPDIEAAFQITGGGGTGIITGKLSDWKVHGPSSYRRGRLLCCMLIELKSPV